MMKRFIAAAIAAASLTGTSLADTTAITNARIYTMGKTGEIRTGTIVMRDGRILAAGAGVKVPAGAKTIDAAGRIVTPGFYIAGSNMGALEIDQVSATNDTATSNATLSAAFDISYGIDPDTMVVPVARLGGITRALVTPGYGEGDHRDLLFAGQAAIVSLAEGPSPVQKARAAMVLELGESGASRAGGSRGSAITALRADLDDVLWYARNRGAYNSGSTRELRLSRPDLEALIPVVRGSMKLIVGVHRASDIREVLKLARDYRLNIVLAGAEEGWKVANDIARARVPVLLNPTTNLPGSFEMRDATMDNAARLAAAGVTIAFANGDGAHRAREARYNAGNAVAHGLPYEAALAALTVNPARIFGEAGTVGSIEPGKQADLVMWSGDPLEPLSVAEAVFIAGESQDMTSRQDELARRYRELSAPLPPAYRD